jgi:hypothetical protein
MPLGYNPLSGTAHEAWSRRTRTAILGFRDLDVSSICHRTYFANQWRKLPQLHAALPWRNCRIIPYILLELAMGHYKSARVVRGLGSRISARPPAISRVTLEKIFFRATLLVGE